MPRRVTVMHQKKKRKKWVMRVLNFKKHLFDFWVKKLWNDKCKLLSYWAAHSCMLTTESCKQNTWLYTLILPREKKKPFTYSFFFCFVSRNGIKELSSKWEQQSAGLFCSIGNFTMFNNSISHPIIKEMY